MDIAITKTATGQPRVTWAQRVPHRANWSKAFQFAALHAVVAGLCVYWIARLIFHAYQDTAIMFTGVLGLLAFLSAFGTNRDDRDRREAIDNAVGWTTQQCEASLVPVDDRLMFRRSLWNGASRRGAPDIVEIWADQIDAFVVGSYRDWFRPTAITGPKANHPESHAIIVQGPNSKVILIAQDGESRAEIARLQATLTQLFIGVRPDRRTGKSGGRDDPPSSV